MRNYKVDIDELYKRIEALELDNIHTERQRKRISAKKRSEATSRERQRQDDHIHRRLGKGNHSRQIYVQRRQNRGVEKVYNVH